MELALTLIDRYKTPITLVLVAMIIVGGGVIGFRSLQIRSLMNQATASTLGSSDEVRALKATQAALQEELAQLQTQATALAANTPSSDETKKSSSESVGSSSKSASTTVHLNSATLAQLETLPGIGATKAQAILDYRNSHGSFTSINQLLNVKGIGEATLAKMKSQLTLD